MRQVTLLKPSNGDMFFSVLLNTEGVVSTGTELFFLTKSRNGRYNARAN